MVKSATVVISGKMGETWWWFVIVFVHVIVVSPYEYGFGRQYTREVQIKQGKVKGLIVEPRWNHALAGVEQYLGLPYAAPPIGEMRFMPPGSAPQWHDTKFADSPGPVCPQKFPDLQKMSADHREKFNRLRQHLLNESEDCLYLNIYAPLQGIDYLFPCYFLLTFLEY